MVVGGVWQLKMRSASCAATSRPSARLQGGAFGLAARSVNRAPFASPPLGKLQIRFNPLKLASKNSSVSQHAKESCAIKKPRPVAHISNGYTRCEDQHSLLQ